MSNQQNSAQNQSQARTSSQASSPEMTVIGTDTQIKGEMFFEKSAKILGAFEGKITAQGEVQISNGANCNAAIEAQSVIVDGLVNGPIVARGQLTLTANAQVQGDLTAGTLVVAQGASFVGHCNVGPAAQDLLNNAQNSSANSQEIKSTMSTKVDLTPPWATNQIQNQAPAQTA